MNKPTGKVSCETFLLKWITVKYKPVFLYVEIPCYIIVPDRRVGCCLGPKGNGVNPGGGDEGGPGPPDGERDKQSTASREGVNRNMEQEEEGKKSQAWQRGPIVHRVSILLMIFAYVCKYYQAVMRIEINVIFVYLFQENKSYGNKPFAFILWCYITVCHRHVWHNNTYMI